MAAEGRPVEEQLDLVAVGDRTDRETGARRPVPLDQGGVRPGGPVGLLAGEDAQLHQGVVAPVGRAPEILRLLPPGEVEEAGARAAARQASRFSQVVDPRPDELANHVVIVAYAE